MKCTALAGFLIPRPCRNEATNACPQCNAPICVEHTVAFPEGGLSCPACARANQEPEEDREVYDAYGYNLTGGFGRGLLFTPRDFEAFEGEQSTGAGEWTGGELVEELDGS